MWPIRDMRSLVAAVVVGFVVLSGTVAATASPHSPTAGTTDSSTLTSAIDACAPLSTESGPSDPERDKLGREQGCRYDETIRIDQSDGLNRTELDALVAHTMARVEVVRQLEFETAVPVTVISRQTYARQTASRYTNTSEAERIRANVTWEALFMVDERTGALGVEQSNAVGTGGYYDPDEGHIVVVSQNATAPTVDETTLAHELVHAIQNQHFDVADRYDLSTFERRRTIESQNAIDGLVEGDANLVQLRYERRCRATWDCLAAPSGGSESGSRHWGMYLVYYQPYGDGPKFVDTIYRKRGWAGVDAVYANPPATTEQVIYPGRYPAEPVTVEFTDESGDEWRLLEVADGQPEYASVGQPGITSMVLYPFFDSGLERMPVIPLRIFANTTADETSEYDPFKYGNNPYAEGWDGDRLYPYVSEDSGTTGETGYVWKTVWETENDSQEFVEGYQALLEYYNATPVEGRESTYRIPEGDRYADAFYVERIGDTVYVVNAPSVADLSQIYPGATPATSFPGPAIAVLGIAVLVGVGLLVRSRR